MRMVYPVRGSSCGVITHTTFACLVCQVSARVLSIYLSISLLIFLSFVQVLVFPLRLLLVGLEPLGHRFS